MVHIFAAAKHTLRSNDSVDVEERDYNAALVAAGAKRYRRAQALMKTYVTACPSAEDARKAKDQMVQWGALAERKEQWR